MPAIYTISTQFQGAQYVPIEVVSTKLTTIEAVVNLLWKLFYFVPSIVVVLALSFIAYSTLYKRISVVHAYGRIRGSRSVAQTA